MKYVYLVFVFALIGIIPSAYADIETPNSISKIIGYEDLNTPIIQSKILPYDRIDNGDTYQNYIIKENDYDIIYESVISSYTFNKQTCSMSTYDGGHVDGKQKELVLSHTMKEAEFGTDTWTSATENGASCNLSYTENQDGTVRVTAKKGDWKTYYDIDFLGMVEWTYDFKNNDFFDQNKKVGFTMSCTGEQCDNVKVDGDVAAAIELKDDLAGKKITIGDYMFDPKNEQHDMLWAMKKSNDKLSVDFTDSKEALGFGESVIVDPIFSKSIPRTFLISTPAATGTICSHGTKTETNSTGNSSISLNNPASGGSSTCSRLAGFYDISFLPTTLSVKDSTIIIKSQGSTNGGRNCDIKPLNSTFLTYSADQKWFTIGNTTNIISNNSLCTNANGIVTNFDLGSTFDTFVQTQRNTSKQYVGLALQFTNETRDTITHGFSFNPTVNLIFSITYTTSINPATNLSCSSAGIINNCTWTAPTLTGDTNSKIYNYSSTDNDVRGVYFKSDGTRFYLAGRQNDNVYQYNLSTPWDLSTASLSSSFSIASQSLNNAGLYFKTDGSKMYVSDSTSSKGNIYQYNLSTPWDITTAAYTNSFNSTTNSNTPLGLFISANGTKMYVRGISSGFIAEYTLSTAWNVTTASFIQASSTALTNPAMTTAPTGVYWSNSGTKLTISDNSDRQFITYNATNPFSISTLDRAAKNTWFIGAAYPFTSYSPTLGNVQQFVFDSTGSRLYFVDFATDGLIQFNLGTNYDLRTAAYTTSSSNYVTTNYIFRSLNNSTFVNQSTVGNVTTSNLSGLSTGTSYYIKLISSDGVFNSTYSNTAQFTTDTTPTAPTISNMAQITQTSFNVTSAAGASDGGDPVVWYSLRCEKNHAGGWINHVTNSSLPSNRKATVTSASPTASYVCQWRDGNGVGFSSWSSNATLQMYPQTYGTLTIPNIGVIGDTGNFTAKFTLTNGPSNTNITQSRLYVNSVLEQTRTETITNLSNGSSVYLDPYWYHGLTLSSKNIQVGLTITNVTSGGAPTTSTPISANYAITASYIPNYNPSLENTATEGSVNYTISRFNGQDGVLLKVNRQGGSLGNTWEIDCIVQNNREAYQTHPGVGRWEGTWINRTGTGYFNGTWTDLTGTHAYVTCINPPGILFTTTSYTNSSLALFGIQIFDDTYGAMLGVPVGVFFLVLTAGMANKRTAPTWMIVILGMAGVMATIGFFSLDPLVWGLALITALLGALVNSKAF